jgi:hypothetical protein
MNKFTRLLALLLLVVMTVSMVSCDKIPFLGDLFDKPDAEHTHSYVDGKCDCGEILYTTIKDLTDKYSNTELFYVKATVKKVVDETTGEMIIADENGEITVKALVDANGVSYAELASKPDEADEVVLQCALQKKSGTITVKNAILVSFTAVEAPLNIISIAEAFEICAVNTDETERLYYIRATVTKVSNPTYGEMYVSDGTNEILVYNTKNADGTVGYADMAERPVKGDEVLLFCTLNNHNGTNQIKSAWVIEFKHVEVEIDPSLYTEMTIAEAREAEADKLIKVKGVVAQITYATGYKPSGVILVDGTSSIYVYDGDIAGQVKIGNTIEVAGSKAYWILETEITNANKFGYKGCNQIDQATLLSNDKGNTEFDKSWITETTVKEIMDTPITEDITTKIYKVDALINRVPASGYVNYYLNDIDGVTGTYTYTQCNGDDFAWLDQFDGKICSVYIVALNAKSTASGCNWRFIPVAVTDNEYEFDTTKAAEYAVKYHGVDQFLSEYTGDPALELITNVDSDLLGFEGATLSYASSNEAIVYFTTEDGKTVMHCGKTGTATVTVTGSYNGNEYSKTVEICVSVNSDVEYINVTTAIGVENNTTVTVKGIVGPSLTNQVGFYLIDETGAIPVRTTKEIMGTLAIGYEVIISGTRAVSKDGGQICINDAEIVSNNYGSHAYSTDSFITDKTIDEIASTTDTPDATVNVYIVTAKVAKTSTQQGTYTNVQFWVGNVLLYTGNANQYSWIQDNFFAEGELEATLTVELALCDWNAKGLKGCVLAVYNEDGSKVYNELNFIK